MLCMHILWSLLSQVIFFHLPQTTRVHAAAAKSSKDAIVTTPSGLQYVDHVLGTGDQPEAGWIVQVAVLIP